MSEAHIDYAGPDPDDAARRPPDPRRFWLRLALLAVSVAALFWVGMQFRWWHWEWTAPVHFHYDMDGALGFGRGSVRDGFVNDYDDVAHRPAPDWTRRFRHAPKGMPDYGLDYSPLRLLVFHLWVKWLATAQPGLRGWSPAYAVNRPLLLFNTANEIAAATLAGLIVWRCRTRAGRPYASALGVAAAALLWLNPQLLASSWGRPAWEVWVLPAYLGAVFLAAENRWLAAGAVVCVGIMLKGQLGVVAPVFVLWPLMTGNWRGALAWVAGFFCAAAAVVIPWMLTRPAVADTFPMDRVADRGAIAWVVGGIVASAGLLVARRRVPADLRWTLDAAAGAVALTLAIVVLVSARHLSTAWAALPEPPLTGRQLLAVVAAVLVGSVGLVAAVRYAPWPDVPMTAAACVAALLFSCVPLFHGSMNWYHIGFEYGAAKFTGLDVGGSTSIAAILQDKYGLRDTDPVWTSDPGPTHPSADPVNARGRANPGRVPATAAAPAITVERALWFTYALGLLISSWGLARLHKARDVRWLVAVATPWLVYFAVAPRMHERYLLWGAAVASVVIGADLGLALLGVGVLGVVSWANTMLILMRYGNPAAMGLPGLPNFGTWAYTAIAGANPDWGWVAALVALIFLYHCLVPPRRRVAVTLPMAVPATAELADPSPLPIAAA